MTVTEGTGSEASAGQPAPSYVDRFRLANDLLVAGKVAEAADIYADLLALRPKAADLLCKLADAKARLGDRAEAFALLHRAIEANSEMIWGHIGLAQLHAKDRNHEAAIGALERAMQCKNVPPFAPIELTRQLVAAAQAAARSNRPDLAKQRFRQALDYAGDDPALTLQVRSGLANLFAAESRFEQAISVLQPVAEAAGQQMTLLLDQAAYAGPERILVADGRDDEEGRVLDLLAALREAAPNLGRVRLRFVNVSDNHVRDEIAALQWDLGIEVEVIEAEPEAALEGSKGFLAVAQRREDHLFAYRQAASKRGIPELIAVATCGATAPARAWSLASAVGNPQLLARRIVGQFAA